MHVCRNSGKYFGRPHLLVVPYKSRRRNCLIGPQKNIVSRFHWRKSFMYSVDKERYETKAFFKIKVISELQYVFVLKSKKKYKVISLGILRGRFQN